MFPLDSLLFSSPEDFILLPVFKSEIFVMEAKASPDSTEEQTPV